MDQRARNALVNDLTDATNELASIHRRSTRAGAPAVEDRRRHTSFDARAPPTFTDDDAADAEKIAAAYEVLAEEQQRRGRREADGAASFHRRARGDETAPNPSRSPGPNPTCRIVCERGHPADHARRPRRGVQPIGGGSLQSTPVRGFERHRFAQLRAPEAPAERTLAGDFAAVRAEKLERDGRCGARATRTAFDAIVASGGFSARPEPQVRGADRSRRASGRCATLAGSSVRPAARISFLPPVTARGHHHRRARAGGRRDLGVDERDRRVTRRVDEDAADDRVQPLQTVAGRRRSSRGRSGRRTSTTGRTRKAFAQVLDVVFGSTRVSPRSQLPRRDGRQSIEQVQAGVVRHRARRAAPRSAGCGRDALPAPDAAIGAAPAISARRGSSTSWRATS